MSHVGRQMYGRSTVLWYSLVQSMMLRAPSGMISFECGQPPMYQPSPTRCRMGSLDRLRLYASLRCSMPKKGHATSLVPGFIFPVVLSCMRYFGDGLIAVFRRYCLEGYSHHKVDSVHRALDVANQPETNRKRLTHVLHHVNCEHFHSSAAGIVPSV